MHSFELASYNEPSIAKNTIDVYCRYIWSIGSCYRIPVVSSCGANNLHFYWDSAACEYLQNWSPDFPAPVKHWTADVGESVTVPKQDFHDVTASHNFTPETLTYEMMRSEEEYNSKKNNNQQNDIKKLSNMYHWSLCLSS